MNRQKLIRSAGVVGVATVLVRVAGLGREMVSAYFFGTDLVYDAFLLAFMIPNFFRGILGEGALNSAFIPVFSGYLGPDKKEAAQQLLSDTVGAGILLAGGVALAVFLSSSVLRMFPLGESVLLTLSFLRFTIFYLVFISLAALAMGVLNSLGHFAAPALSPLGLDLFWILGLVLLAPLLGENLVARGYGLVAGVVLGGGAQLLISMAPLRRRFSLKPTFNLKNPALRQMGRLLLPVTVGMTVVPVNLLVDYLLARIIAPGMVSSLWYAKRLVQLPLGVFGIAVGTAALPAFSRLAAAGNRPELKRTILFSLKSTFLLVVPASFLLFFFREPIIAFLFQRGLFTAQSTRDTAIALLFYTPGIFAYAGGVILTRAFFALRDTRTPVKVGVLSIAVNLGLDLLLMGPLGHGGIALATSLVGFCNFTLLFLLLRRKIGPLGGRALWRDTLKIFAASAGATGLALWCFRYWFASLGPALALVAALALAAVVYGAAGYLAVKRNRPPRARP